MSLENLNNIVYKFNIWKFKHEFKIRLNKFVRSIEKYEYILEYFLDSECIREML